MKKLIPANDDEPDPICGNCHYYREDLNGRWWCVHANSGKNATEATDGCKMFFPDFKRWPDADHG